MKQKPDKLVDVSIDLIEPHPLNRPTGNIDELAEDLEANGQMTPCIVRPLPKEEPGATPRYYTYQMLAGHRRLAAGIKKVRGTLACIVRDLNDEDAMLLLMRENLHRVNVHPMAEALYYRRLLDAAADIESIAAEIGKPVQYVHRRLALTDLIPTLRKPFEVGKISLGAAEEFARVASDTQVTIAKRLTEMMPWRADVVAPKAAREWIAANVLQSLNGVPWSTESADLLPGAGPCTTCPKRSGTVPTLFGDLKGTNLCTDPKCFDDKAANAVQETLATWEAEGVDWHPVALTFAGDAVNMWGKKIVTHYTMRKCAADHDGALQGIVAIPSHDKPQELGKPIHFILQTEGGRATRFRESPALKASRLRAARKSKVRLQTRRLAFEALAHSAPLASAIDHKAIAASWWSGIWHDARKAMCLAYGWKPTRARHGHGFDFEAVGLKQIKAMSHTDLQRFMRVLSFARGFSHGNNEHSSGDGFLASMKRAGVNVAQCARLAELKYPVPVKKKAKKARRSIAK